ncbi:MAG: hypothetical protein AB1758_31450 [Candidatus Eremiobacterota bacterium]
MSTSTPRFEPLSFGALLDQTFRFYVRDFVPLALLSLICNAPVLVGSVLGVLLLPAHSQPLVNLAILPVAVVTGSLLVGALTITVSQRYLGQPVSIGAALSRTLRSLLSLIGSQLLVGIWIFLGLLLFIVPGILWAFSLSLVVPAVILEGCAGSNALARSKELVRYQRGKVVGVIVVIGLLVLMLQIAMGATMGVVVAASGGSFEGNVWLEIASNLMAYILAPLSSVALVLLYYDLRIRKEGFDLEMLSGEMTRS